MLTDHYRPETTLETLHYFGILETLTTEESDVDDTMSSVPSTMDSADVVSDATMLSA